MINGLPVLTGCDVTLSVAGKGKLTTRTAGNAYTMPHQLDVGPKVPTVGLCCRQIVYAVYQHNILGNLYCVAFKVITYICCYMKTQL